MSEVVEQFFEQYEIGATRTTTGRTITEADIVLHAGQTGDFYPHHMDREWCSTQPFGRRIAHGTLVLSVAVGMTAGAINPRAMSYGYDRIRFVRPVFIGDTITVTTEIAAKSDHPKSPERLGRVDERLTVANQAGEVVLALVHLYVVEKQADVAAPGGARRREVSAGDAPAVTAPADLAERLGRLYTGIVFDVMRAIGCAPGVLAPGIHALDPGRRLAGPVWTVHGRMVEGADPHETLLGWTRMLSAAPAGSVVVCQPENQEIALMGELSSEAMKFRGVRGYVVDGGCRDTEFIRTLGFPVYCRFATPSDIVGRWLPDELGGSVVVAGVRIATGDYLLADRDGIVVLPGERAAEIVAAAEATAQVENRVRTAILSGTDPEQAYLEHGKF